jgi:hypothetical protein
MTVKELTAILATCENLPILVDSAWQGDFESIKYIEERMVGGTLYCVIFTIKSEVVR